MNTAWQPIETAPMDGTEIVICKVVDGAYLHRPRVARRIQRMNRHANDCPVSMPAGWWRSIHGEIINPTHWMPLPEPPA